MFGLGKKKQAGPPENNNLGKLLDAMMRDPEQNQGAFYTAFLTSNVFVIGEAGGEPGEKMLQGGDKVRVMHWADPNGNPFMPIFTSMDELKAATAEMGEINYVAMAGYDALNLTQGQSPVAIDPSSEHCLYLAPPQIGQILNYFDSIKEN
jgi:SseB protein N-terminal domain